MRWLVIILLGLGIWFRFVNLDHKVYWYDETFTSLRAAGYTEAEVVQHFAQRSIVPVSELQRYQQPEAGSERQGIKATIQSLAIEDTHHPPLYYGLAHVWMRSVGSSAAAMRGLPALLSLLAFPAVYWLCREVFQGTSGMQVGWVAMGIIAVSPFQVLYAQESRQYGLWGVTTLLMTAALLQAIRTHQKSHWAIYAVSLAASLYTFLFAGFVAIAHGIYVLVLCKCRPNQTLLAYGVATLIGTIAFLPWAWTVATHLEQAQAVTDWTTTHRTFIELLTSWASILGRLFYDRGTTVADRLVQIGMIGLIGLAFYILCRQTPKSTWLLIVLLTGVPALALVLPDLLVGGLRSTFPRYLIPALLGIQIAVAYVLAASLTPVSLSAQALSVRQQHLWRWVTIAVFSAGILSCLTISQAPQWWPKTHNKENPAVAQVINQATRPLVLSDADTGDLLSLSHLLNADVDLLIRPRCYTCHMAAPEEINPSILYSSTHYTDIFLFHPRASKQWKRSLHNLQNYQLEPTLSDLDEVLWKQISK